MRRNTTDRPKGTFLTWHSAEERGRRFVSYIKDNFTSDKITFVDNRGIGINDLVFDDATAFAVVERFKREKVDAVMIINCNFGNEEAAADIAREIGKPVLLWAPLDDEYYVHGMRPTDSQCGVFGVSRQMQRYHIPFSHLPSCRVESEEFELDELTPQYIKPMATLAAVYKHLFDEFNLNIISAECWTATPIMFDGLAPCAVYGLLSDLGYMISCESDIHAALTMVLLKSATLEKGILQVFSESVFR